MQPNPNAWKKWHDPKTTEKDYERWREQHRDRLRKQALAMMQVAITPTTSKAPITSIATASGLSASTVRKYVRDGRIGPRGPSLTTYLALKLLHRIQ